MESILLFHSIWLYFLLDSILFLPKQAISIAGILAPSILKAVKWVSAWS